MAGPGDRDSAPRRRPLSERARDSHSATEPPRDRIPPLTLTRELPAMDSHARAFLDELNKQEAPGWHELPTEEARAGFSALAPVFETGPEVSLVEDRTVAGVPCRAYVPDGASGVVVYLHGGGWVLGDLETHDTICRRLAAAAGAGVLSVDYRRPPEHPFPAPLDDCVTVTEAVFAGAAGDLPVGPVLVAGDSAGGNLAAGVAVRVGGRLDLAGLVLMYPVLDVSMSTESYREFATGHGLTADTMAYFWKCYAPTAGEATDPAANPADADLSNFPPTVITSCGYDVLRDEAHQFADRLKEAGRDVTEIRHDDQVHGFMHFTGAVPAGRDAATEVASATRTLLDRAA